MTLEQRIESMNKLNISESFDWHYILNEDIKEYSQLIEEMESQNLMNVEIIYDHTAIDFLKEHDPSLKESLEMASELGYTFENLSSEVLASLLATQQLYDEFSENHDAINEILEDDDLEEDSSDDNDDEPVKELIVHYVVTYKDAFGMSKETYKPADLLRWDGDTPIERIKALYEWFNDGLRLGETERIIQSIFSVNNCEEFKEIYKR